MWHLDTLLLFVKTLEFASRKGTKLHAVVHASQDFRIILMTSEALNNFRDI